MFNKWLKVESSRIYLLDIIFILIAIAISIYAREAFISYSSAFKMYFFNGERILTTNDAYHFATATKDLVSGHFKDSFYPVAALELPSLLSAFFYHILPLSLDKLFFLMPVFASSLLAIPVFLIAKEISNRYVALFAAILAPLTQGYANRTIAGYYDTDMLILTLPLFGIYFLIRLLRVYSFRDLGLATIFFIFALAWHKTSATYILFASLFIATIYIFIAKKKDYKLYESVGVLIVAISYMDIFVKIILIAILLHFIIDKPLLFSSFTAKIKKRLKFKSLIIFLIGISVLLVANADLLISKFSIYVTENVLDTSNIVFKKTSNTIMELQNINFDDLIRREIGDKIGFIIALIGILLMFVKEPRSMILLPFIILGATSLKLGMRFSMFSAPVFSIGFFYLIYFLSSFANKIFKDKIVIVGTKAAVMLIFGFMIIAPNYYYSKNLLIQPVINGMEISALNAIKEDSKSRDDVTISWWDYGFMIPYYANTHTIISGTDLDGVNHFIASFILSNENQLSSYNMAKLAVDAIYQSSNDKENAKLHNINKILKKYDSLNNPQEFFQTLGDSSFKAPSVNRDIYIYLPFSILPIQTAIDEFSDIDYTNGQVIHKEDTKTLAIYNATEDKDGNYKLDGKLLFNPKIGEIESIEEKKKKQVQKFHIIEKKNGILTTTTTSYNDDKDKLHIIYSKKLKMFFAIDDRTNNSLIVQLFIYENYDKNLFTLLYSDEYSKAYKLK